MTGAMLDIFKIFAGRLWAWYFFISNC